VINLAHCFSNCHAHTTTGMPTVVDWYEALKKISHTYIKEDTNFKK